MAFFQELYHLDRILLSKHEAALRVALFGHPLRQAEAHVHVALHALPHLHQASVYSKHLINLLLNLLGIFNWNIILMQLADLVLDSFANYLFPLLINHCDLDELRFSIMSFGEPANERGAYAKL